MTLGMKPLDALHLALEESAHTDYFRTCDDKLQNSKPVADLMVKVANPVDLIQEVEK